MIRVAALFVYPVKGLRGVPLRRADVDRCGLAHDRRWAIAGPDGRVLTQRELPALATIDATIDGPTLRLGRDGQGGVDAHPTEEEATIDVWGTRVPVRRANAAASRWLATVLGVPCTLVHQHDPGSRPVTPDLARPGDTVSLADGFPLLVTSAASLDDLNARLVHPVPMDRFRPNLVVDGAPAWAEDAWAGLDLPGLGLRLVSPCSRCKVTTLDQRTGANPARNEPLKTLGQFHRDAGGRITFGWNAVPIAPGRVAVGEGASALQR